MIKKSFGLALLAAGMAVGVGHAQAQQGLDAAPPSAQQAPADTPPAQPAQVYSYPSLPWQQHLYYDQHPDEFQKLLENMPPVSHTLVPGNSLAPGAEPVPGTWTSLTNTQPGTLNLSNPVLLTDGTVIAHVSCDSRWFKLTPDNAGSYINGTWLQIASLPGTYAPRFFGSGVLPDGRVMAEGGEYNGAGCGSRTTLGAVYDPVLNTWTAVSPPAGWGTISDAAGIVLANGTYMQTSCCDNPAHAALFNRWTKAWTNTGTGKFDPYDEESMALMPNGTVLTVNAYTQTGTCGLGSQAYNPATGSWSSTGNVTSQQSDCQSNPNRAASFEVGPLVMRPDGTAVSFSGVTVGTPSATIWNTATSTWGVGPSFPSVGTTPYTMADAPGAVLPNGNILVAMSPSNWVDCSPPGCGRFPGPTHWWELNISINTFTQVPDKVDSGTTNSFQHNFLVLPTGQVASFATDDPNIQIYTPVGSFQSSWRPVVNSSPACVSPQREAVYVASGTQLNGLSEGAYYGDDTDASTNFPLVRIVNNSTGHVSYARTFAHSNRSIASGNAGLTKFAVINTETGPSTLFVVANGIPSAGTAVNVAVNCPRGSTPSTHDFNGGGISDIAWRDGSGNTAAWAMGTLSVLSTATFGNVPLAWSIVGQRDFNGDGNGDWLWRDTAGNLSMWFLNGNTVSGVASVGNVAPNWVVAGTGDFDGGGIGDILWRDTNTGTVAIWLMNGSQVIANVSLGTVTSNWVIAGTADVNGDGKTDIIWRDSNTGTVVIWFMNSTAVASTSTVGAVGGSWNIVGTGDFDGDGLWDILWQDGSGNVAVWLMNGGQVGGAGGLGAVPAPWHIVFTGELSNDGKSDIVWRNTSTGDVAIWSMNGLSVLASTAIGTVTTNWTIQGLNAD